VTDLRKAEDEGWFVDGTPIHRFAYGLRVLPENAPGRRGSNLTIARRAGAQFRAKEFSERRQLFTMQLFDVDEFGRKGHEALQFNLNQLKRIWYGDGEVEVERRLRLPDGRSSSRFGRGEVVDAIDFDIVQSANHGRFVVDLLMSNPFWYEPVNVAENKSGEFVVNNPGTVETRKVVVRFKGAATNPTLTNHTSGSEVTYGDAIAGGDFVELDSELFTAKDQDGLSVVGDVSRDSIFFVTLVPGINRLELTSGTCDVSFRPAFL
jgi:hypothetical protein